MSTLGAGVVELDEGVRRVGGRTGADAELVDLDRADVPHLLGRVSRTELRAAGFVHEALPTRSPLKAAGPEVTLKVALTLAPGATGQRTSSTSRWCPNEAVHCLLGTEMLSLTPVAARPWYS
jgi:hypothetical protein